MFFSWKLKIKNAKTQEIFNRFYPFIQGFATNSKEIDALEENSVYTIINRDFFFDYFLLSRNFLHNYRGCGQ